MQTKIIDLFLVTIPELLILVSSIFYFVKYKGLEGYLVAGGAILSILFWAARFGITLYFSQLPGYENYMYLYTFSQVAGKIAYLTFAVGFSLIVRKVVKSGKPCLI